MKFSILSILFFILPFNIEAQKTFVSLGSGYSNLSSNYEKRYSPDYNFTLKAGYDKYLNRLRLRASVGYINFNSLIIENNKRVKFGLIKISTGLVYKISSSLLFSGQISFGKTTTESLRISPPSYNYDFDPFDMSYSFEVSKKIKLNSCNCLSFGLEFSKSLDGIIDNNFWQKDNLKPYYLNANVYYHFDE